MDGKVSRFKIVNFEVFDISDNIRVYYVILYNLELSSKNSLFTKNLKIRCEGMNSVGELTGLIGVIFSIVI